MGSITPSSSRPVPTTLTIKGTIRYRLRISQGGTQLRLRLSNEYRETPLRVEEVSLGIAGEGLNVLPGSLRLATFAGEPFTVIPAGAPALSDPIDLAVPSLADLIVSVYLPAGASVLVWPVETRVWDQVLIPEENATRLERIPESANVAVRPLVSAVTVQVNNPRPVVVALGDSITDGGVDPVTGDRGWPGVLSRRLHSYGVSVVNAGIGGNRLLKSIAAFGRSALARLDQDVFSVPGVSHVVVLEGINDIGCSGPGGMFGDEPLIEPDELIAAFCQISARAHERNIKVICATIPPFEDAIYYSDEKDRVRTAVNHWMKSTNVFDAVVDFDAVLRDPLNIRRLKEEYDPGDHLHPNVAGCQAMGNGLDPGLFL